jgi:lipopolysaccharide transport system permease protein
MVNPVSTQNSNKNSTSIWQYRELIKNLTVVELKNRYQNTGLGFIWSILSPFLFALVLYFVFRFLFMQEKNFPSYLLVGMMAWRFFVMGTNSSVYAVVGKANLVTKIYIPRSILVLSNLLANFVSSLLEFIVLIPILFILLPQLPWTIVLFPVVHLVLFWFIYGIGLCLGALFVYFKDINQIWEVLTNILFFLSPIVYPMAAITEKTMPYYQANPITAAIMIYRDLMIYGNMPSLYNMGILVICSLFSFLIGSFIFNKLQRRFAEAI